MSHNSNTLDAETFLAYDQLPREIQLALAHFPQNMSSEFALAQIKRGISPAKLKAMLEAKRVEFTQAGVPPLDPESYYRAKSLRRNVK